MIIIYLPPSPSSGGLRKVRIVGAFWSLYFYIGSGLGWWWWWNLGHASFLGASGGGLCRVTGVPATAAYERVVAGVVVGCLWVVVWALGG